MGFIKKFIFGAAAFFLILWGGAGTQSKSLLMQGGGFVGLIIGLIVLYLFLKMVWRAMGCLPSIFILLGILAFILYAIGIFKDGPSGVINNLKGFIGQASTSGETEESFASENNEETITIGEGFSSSETTGSFQDLMKQVSGSAQQKQSQARDAWSNLPVIESSVSVISGDTLKIGNHYFVIYGIDAPEISQTCSDASGRAYNCGRQAISWLRDWVLDSPLTCKVMKQSAKGNMIGTCSFGPYDIGAAIVNAGWALANTKQTTIYLPYEKQAKEERRGLWQGKFYKPEDWRKAQKLKPKIKVIKPKEKNHNAFFSF